MRRGAPSLNRPHPSHSWAHRDFAARRLVRDAFAVREHLGDPRVVPSFHRTSFLTCRPFQPRGVRHRYCPELRRRVGLRRMAAGSALPSSRNPFHGGGRFGGFTGSLSLKPAELLAPCTDQTGIPSPATGDFTFRLSTDRSPSRCFIQLQQRLDSSVGGTLTRWNGS